MHLLRSTLVYRMQHHHWKLSCRFLLILLIERHHSNQACPQLTLLLFVRHFSNDIDLLVPHLNDNSRVRTQIENQPGFLAPPADAVST